MSQEKVVLLLGSNLGDRNFYLESARSFISSEVGRIIKEGEIVETEPVEFTSEELFLNQLVLLETDLSPVCLLARIKSIEKKLGRAYFPPKNGEKYISRKIDIDILLFGSINYSCKFLTIPHTQIFTRKFVKELLFGFNQ